MEWRRQRNGVKSIALCCISAGVFNVFKDIDFEIYEKLLNG